MMRFLSCKVVQSYVNIDTLLVSTLFLLQEKTFAGTNVKPFLGGTEIKFRLLHCGMDIDLVSTEKKG